MCFGNKSFIQYVFYKYSVCDLSVHSLTMYFVEVLNFNEFQLKYFVGCADFSKNSLLNLGIRGSCLSEQVIYGGRE